MGREKAIAVNGSEFNEEVACLAEVGCGGLIEEGKIDTRPWITHQADFDEVIAAFPDWVNPETGVIKAMVRVN